MLDYEQVVHPQMSFKCQSKGVQKPFKVSLSKVMILTNGLSFKACCSKKFIGG
jgi:hypothetical protein